MDGHNLLDERAPDSPLAPTTLRAKTEQIRRYLSALVRSGAMNPSAITSLAVALSPACFAAAVQWYLERNCPADPSPRRATTPSLDEMAETLLGIARHWARLDGDALKALEKMVAKLRCRRRGMTDRNMARLRPLLDPAVQRSLLFLPETLLAEAQRQKNPKKAALRVQTALAIELLLVAPMRLGNLLRLELDRHIVFARPNRRGQARIVIAPHEVKNRVPLDFPLQGDTLKLLDLYLRRHLPVLTGVDSIRHLFPGAAGGHKSEMMLYQQITGAIRRHVGITMNPISSATSPRPWSCRRTRRRSRP
jgi:hypothetical protein